VSCSWALPHRIREHGIVESTGWSCEVCLVYDRLGCACDFDWNSLGVPHHSGEDGIVESTSWIYLGMREVVIGIVGEAN
jgi:hypothetical protein